MPFEVFILSLANRCTSDRNVQKRVFLSFVLRCEYITFARKITPHQAEG